MPIKKSPWLLHYDASSCNGCDIEVLACLTPLYDVERFGIINTGNPKHADILLITGSINEQNRPVVRNLYHQMPDPKVVVAVGICATSGGIFADCYNVIGGVDKLLPVDVYVFGCAARPESIIDGVVKALDCLQEKQDKRRQVIAKIKDVQVEQATIADAQEILEVQKLSYRSEAEIYNDYSLAPLIQTYQELMDDFKKQIFLKITVEGQIIGSVRGYESEGTCYISRLFTHPSFHNFGLGSKLINAIEQTFPKAKKFEVFTWHQSKRNIYFYQTNGYKTTKTVKVSDQISNVYLEKPGQDAAHYL